MWQRNNFTVCCSEFERTQVRDDIRESPAVDMIEYLLQRGARIHAHDPHALWRAEERFGNRIKRFDNKYAAVCGADALVIMTEWDAYKSPDYHELSERLKHRQPLTIDEQRSDRS